MTGGADSIRLRAIRAKRGGTLGQIDKLQRQVLNVNENFVDAISKETRKYGIEIDANDLEDVYPSNVVVGNDGSAREIVADVRKFWKSKDALIALFGIESQTSVDRTMVVRIMEYDAAKYKEQVKKNPNECRPVITFVLNFGKKPWNGPTTLREFVKFVEGTEDNLLPLFNDFRIHVIYICELTLEEIEQMPSDFRFYATFHYNLNHPDEQITYPAVQDGELAHNYVNVLSNGQIDLPVETLEQGGFQMNQLFEEYAARREELLMLKNREEGRKEGREEGRKEGRLEGREEAREEMRKEARIKTQKSAKKMSEKGYSIEVIADLLDESEETIEAWLSQE